MNIPGYDAWKLMTPEEYYEACGGKICPLCGSYSARSCELEEETGGSCPWEESQPDPDDLRDQRGETAAWNATNPRNGDKF